jgi:thiol:disulfide interchange protein DsbD
MSLRYLTRSRSAILLFCALSSAFSQATKQQHANISLISERSSLAPGQPDWIGIRFDLDPGWHIYWTNPGDSGEPPKVTWQLPAGMQAGDLQFPAPQRIRDHSLMDYGYQGTVVLLSKLTIAPGAAPKQAEIGADVRYLVCREICVPGKSHVSLAFVGAAKAISGASQIADAQKHLPQPLPRGVSISATTSPDKFTLTVFSKTPNLGKVTDFIPADEQVIENGAQPDISSGKDENVIKLKKSEQLNHPVSELRGLLITSDRAYNVVVPVTSGRSRTRAKKS